MKHINKLVFCLALINLVYVIFYHLVVPDDFLKMGGSATFYIFYRSCAIPALAFSVAFFAVKVLETYMLDIRIKWNIDKRWFFWSGFFFLVGYVFVLGFALVNQEGYYLWFSTLWKNSWMMISGVLIAIGT